MSDAGASPDAGGADSGADSGPPLSNDQFGDVTQTNDSPYTAQNPYGPVLGVWGFGRNMSARPEHHRRRKHRKHK